MADTKKTELVLVEKIGDFLISTTLYLLRNMKRLSLILIFFIVFLPMDAQCVLLDSLSLTPIANATVCDENGKVIGWSDEKGQINIHDGHEYYITHIGYNTKHISGADSILLSPKSLELSEVTVSAKKKRYCHIKIFFRDIEYVDSCMKYYMAGMKEFFIDTGNRKIKQGTEVAYRYQTSSKEVDQKNRTNVISDCHMTSPYLDKYCSFEEIQKDKKKSIKSTAVLGCDEDTVQIGTYISNPDRQEATVFFDHLYPKKDLTINMFGYTQELTEFKHTEVYDLRWSDTPTLFDIKAKSDYRHMTLAHKKEGFTRQIDINDDMYVVTRKYVDDIIFTPSEQMAEEYGKYREQYPPSEKAKESIGNMIEVQNFNSFGVK